jgi:hypothetical protein
MYDLVALNSKVKVMSFYIDICSFYMIFLTLVDSEDGEDNNNPMENQNPTSFWRSVDAILNQLRAIRDF